MGESVHMDFDIIHAWILIFNNIMDADINITIQSFFNTPSYSYHGYTIPQ